MLGIDLILLFLALLIDIWIKPAAGIFYLERYGIAFGIFVLVWVFFSALYQKYNYNRLRNLRTLTSVLLMGNITALGFIAILLYGTRIDFYSRFVVFGTVGIATALEFLAGLLLINFRKATLQDIHSLHEYEKIRIPSEEELVERFDPHTHKPSGEVRVKQEIVDLMEEECGSSAAQFIIALAGNSLNGRSKVMSTSSGFNVYTLSQDRYNYIVNLRMVNQIRETDKFLDAVNGKLDRGGFFICCVETKDKRKKRLLRKIPFGINYLWYFFDFLWNRICPKAMLTAGMYTLLSNGKYRVISRAEMLGRLCRAGFHIENEAFVGDTLFVQARKVREPFPLNQRYYGAFIALKRIGKGGREFKVYKMRTMHPYSEFLQDYIFELYHLEEGGKFKNDFRITNWGRLARKLWLDELPMIFNMLKGDMKLVGVRPLSRQYFDLYSEETREKRVSVKPGLIPPYYVHLPDTLEEIQASELRYIDEYKKRPLRTDFRYFWLAIFNIVFKSARSK